jgi:hypothetical protein
MKKLNPCRIILLTACLSIPQIAQAQGVTYLSNLGQPPSGALPIASDSWLAADFTTGTNVAGYVLNYVQVAIADAVGSPSGFSAMVFAKSSILTGAVLPGSNLGTLTGSLNPSTAGTYAYTAPQNLTLSPNTDYFIVLTAATAAANGAYEWSVTSTASIGYNAYHWGGQGVPCLSSDGLHWDFLSVNDYPQFAIDATAIPEPGLLTFFVLGGLSLIWHRLKRG